MSPMIPKLFDWLAHPKYADADPLDWFAFVIVLILFGLLWSKVVRATLEAV